tara:strand:+ start:2782 stop:2979 length:198 start_codon:yes stop_codon:yes gene_type:complete
MKAKEKEPSELSRLIHYIENRQIQIKNQEKICKMADNKKDLIKLDSKQIQLFSLLNVLETLNEAE